MIRILFHRIDETKLIISNKTTTDWSNIIYSYAVENGFTNTIYTIYELRENDNFIDAPFHDLNPIIFMSAIDILKKQNKVTVIERDVIDENGVKFLEV